MELLIARNPDPDSTLPYLLYVPIGADGLVFRTKGHLAADQRRRRRRRAGDRGRRPRAVRVQVRRPAGHHRAPWPGVRDYAITLDEKIVAAVERKSLADLVSSLTSGRLRFALGELATLPRAAFVVVEDRYSQVFTLDRDQAWRDAHPC